MAKNEVLKKNTVVVFVVLALGIIVMDPFGLSQIRAYCPDFSPVRHDIAPYDQVMKNWPKHVSRRLERGNRVFVDQVFGPESLEFDALGRGPYTGLADGRVVRWMGEELGWQTFALVTKKWSEKVCANGVNSTTSMQWRVEAHCGRPLGLRFDRKSGDLYIADAYYGLMVVGPEGGLAKSLAADVAGKPILFANDLDIHRNGSVFFTDSSQKYNRVKHFFTLFEGEATGRLLRYDPPTRTTHVVSNGLSFANGVQLSKDQSFLLYAETTNCRLMKYWLEGPKSGTTELVANLPGFPDNVRLNEKGEFWVTIACCRTKAQEVLSNNPWLKNIYFRLPVPLRYLAGLIGTRTSSIISKFNEKGEILDALHDKKGVVMELASEVREERRKLWIGTVAHNHIATLDLES